MTGALPETCPTCGPPRYCAPARCYCGHSACPAFASYIDMSVVPLPPVADLVSPRRGRR